MGDTSARIGDVDIAEKLYKRALDQAEKEKGNAPAEGAAPGSSALDAIPRIRAALVGLLLQKEQYEAGVTEIDKLILEKPKALEPKMVRGRLLQAWAEKEPKYYNDAELQWQALRNMMERMPKKPSEYYEANFNLAWCLYMEYQQAKNKEDPKVVGKLTVARQLLHTMITKSPKLNGPEMVIRYNQLLEKLDKLLPTVAQPPAKAPAKTAAK
jgi:hypothetical protein